MKLSEKEKSLLKDLKSQEQLCVQKYAKYTSDACDAQLKNLFTQIGQEEQTHLQTLQQIDSGTVPQVGEGSKTLPQFQQSSCSAQDKQKDSFLCSDVLATEKHVSSNYNTCIFEFADTGVRNVLNHIQKEEQQHGEEVYSYMAANGMYG